MSWFPEHKTTNSWIHRICTRILKSGPIPKHLAFIMDGNRRFAVKNSIDRAEGHLKGFDKLAETLEWCLSLGISEVTVYAFSIENFKRPKDEVDCLMELARQKFARLMEEKDMITKHEVCVRVLGNLSLLPPDVQATVAEAVNFTQNNTKAFLNVCFAYTARDEISSAIREMAEGVDKHIIKDSDISEELLNRCLYTGHSPDPDLLIRTSGEVRLSDFLLWQSSFTCLAFVKVLWPDFTLWHLYAAILHYQKNYQAIQIARQNNEVECVRRQQRSDYENCIKEFNDAEQAGAENSNLLSRIQHYAACRQERVKQFLQYMDSRRSSLFQELASRRSEIGTCAS